MRKALFAILLAGCAGGAAPPEWQLDTSTALKGFQQHYLSGETRLAERDFALATQEIRRTGRGDLLARAELARCAVRTASLELDDCPAFEALRADAGPEEIAYAEYLAARRERAARDETLSRLVSYGVKFRGGTITPAEIRAAIDLASEQGWRRPLLAWLGVQEKRAAEAGDSEAAAHSRRRIELILGAEVDRAAK